MSTIDVQHVINDIKQEITEYFEKMQTSFVSKIETDIRNNVISNMCDDIKDSKTQYGKITQEEINKLLDDLNALKPTIYPNSIFNDWYHTEQLCKKDVLILLINRFVKHKTEYIINVHIIAQPGFYRHNNMNMSATVDNDGYSCIYVITNYCNIYKINIITRIINHDQPKRRIPIPGTTKYTDVKTVSYSTEPIVETNIMLNNIFIDIMKRNCITADCTQFLEQTYISISQNVKKYWGTPMLGSYKLKIEQMNDRLTTTHNKIISQNVEIKRLEEELEASKKRLEESKKQLADVEVFRQCMLMVQTQHVNPPVYSSCV